MSDQTEKRVFLWPMNIWQRIRKFFGFQKYKIVKPHDIEGEEQDNGR